MGLCLYIPVINLLRVSYFYLRISTIPCEYELQYNLSGEIKMQILWIRGKGAGVGEMTIHYQVVPAARHVKWIFQNQSIINSLILV